MSIVVGGSKMTGSAGASANVVPSGSGVKVTCSSCSPTSLSGLNATVWFDDGRTLLTNDGTRYRDGRLVVTRTPGASTLEVVLRARLHDEYLDYIREVPWSWPSAALQAQAAAARGYALSAYKSGLKSSCNCHLYDTTASQVFGGYPSSGDMPYWSSWTKAVRAAGTSSTGFVARYDGQVIQAFYSSSSGGRTQNSEDVWSSSVPYLRSVDDHWSLRSSNPRRTWTATPSTGSLASAFGLSDVARLDLSSRYVSGGVRTARATSSSGSTATLSGETFRSRLGLNSSYVQRPTTRYAGADRYAVATSVAKKRLPSATTVVIASGETAGRADAAVSGPLAQALDAPLLLTKAGSLPSATRTELSRRSGTLRSAVVVGGPGTVSDAVVSDLRARGLSVTRISGADRYEVSAAAARRIAKVHRVTAAVLASGKALADALGAGGPAGAEGEPILLTRQTGVPTSVKQAIADLGITGIRIAGGTASVSAYVEQGLEQRPSTSVLRLSGEDRYAVAARVASFYMPRLADRTRVSMSSGTDAALTDALTSGSLPHVTVLTKSGSLPAATERALQGWGEVKGIDVFGGQASVGHSVVGSAARS